MVKPAEPGPDGKTSPSSSSGYLTALSVEPDMVNIHASATTPSDPRSRLHQSALTSTTPYQAPREPAHPDSPALSHQQQENSLLTSGVADAAPFQPYRYQKHQSCQYETFLAYQRRRMPYSLGGELLMREEGVKEKLAFGEEQALSGDIEDLYQRLLPTEESDSRRKIFIQKIEALLKERWPMADIGVHVFGSSGNRLSTCDSDVDICITSSNDELETKICTIADLFAKNGMERVICIPHAKVPIVKLWDPTLEVACDMNVNKTSAIENTRMVQTYVDIDERVRPLAMTIKYWAKRRQLNDAALGNTLSSYTWTCLILNFLQTRSPPILPSLHRLHHDKARAKKLIPDPAAFETDLDELRGYGLGNTSSLGTLLFEFFRYYAHEIDYETAVMSVREGKVLPKSSKGWHLLQNNRICVEEPFNTSRNLGNTADDSSFRGLHLELRRAFNLLTTNGGIGGLDRCCELFELGEGDGEKEEEEAEEEDEEEEEGMQKCSYSRMQLLPYYYATPEARATDPTAHFLWLAERPPYPSPGLFPAPIYGSSFAQASYSSPPLTAVTPLPSPLYPPYVNVSTPNAAVVSGDGMESHLQPGSLRARPRRSSIPFVESRRRIV